MLESDKLMGGWARNTIVPPAHYPMAGYLARNDSSRGSLGPLYVRALVLDQGNCCVCILLADLLLISPAWAALLQNVVGAALHTPAHNIIVAATHTHSGPLVETAPFHLSNAKPDARTRRFMHQLEATFVQTAVAARKNLQPVRMSYRRCLIQGLATDRNDRRKNRTQPFQMVCFEAGASRALLGILPCHPTILGAGNLSYSGDLHGEIARRYERQFDVALIANGAAANISTRFTRGSQTRSQIARFASLVMDQANLTPLRTCASHKIAIDTQTAHLPVKDFEQSQNSQSLTQTGRQAEVAREGRLVATQLSRMPEFRRKTVPVQITVLRLGRISFAALPLELYGETGRFLWAKTRTSVLCYANGYWGYTYISQASKADYEVISSPFAVGADNLLRAAIVKLTGKT